MKSAQQSVVFRDVYIVDGQQKTKTQKKQKKKHLVFNGPALGTRRFFMDHRKMLLNNNNLELRAAEARNCDVHLFCLSFVD